MGRRAGKVRSPHPPGGHDLVVAALTRGDHRGAASTARALIDQRPLDPLAWELLAVAAHHLGDVAGAIDAGSRAIALRPGSAPAHANLGVALRAADRQAEAEAAYRRAIEIDPGFAAAHNNLGNLLRDHGRRDEAEASLRAAVRLKPGYVEAWRSLVGLLQGAGRLQDAVEALNAALVASPDHAELLSDLGALLTGLQRFDDAHRALVRATAQDPRSATAHGNLGALYVRAGRLPDAERAARRAHELAPGEHRWLANLAVVAKDLGRWDEAEQWYRKALALAPNYASGHSNLLFCLNYHPDKSAEAIFAEYRLWDRLHAAPRRPAELSFANDPTPDRRLRVGYVSPDFREHSARHFIEPMLAAHDRTRVELFCYAELAAPDAATQRFRDLTDHWRTTAGLDDAALAARIREDRIDVLVDLGGHTASSRLPVFALRPAPVQLAHFLGHGYTSGLSEMDGFLGDAALTPAGFDHLFSEPVQRLARIPLAYEPDPRMPAPSTSPALRNGFTTFGYFGRPERINDRVVVAWAEILKRAPGSRLRLNSRPFADPEFAALMLARFAAEGVAGERLDLVFTTPQTSTWDAYGEIDVALDPFPHNAGTTTIEALWLGTPVLSILDRPSVGRFGASILGALDLQDWVAADVETYVAKAVEAVTHPEGPASLRADLRRRFLASPLADAPGLARALEDGYARLWSNWCAKQGSTCAVVASPQDEARLRALFLADDLDGAGTLAREMIDAAPAAAEAHHILGLIAFRRGDHAEAEAAIGRALALAETAPAWSNLGAARRAAGRSAEAEAAFRRAIALDPALADARRNLVNTLLAGERFEDAAAELRATLAQDPSSREAAERLGDLMSNLGRADAAADAYAAALALAPEAAGLRRKLALTFDRAKRPAEAAAALHQALEAMPDDAPGWAGLADLLRRLGRLGEAETAARRSIAIDPTLPAAENVLGTVLTAQERWLDAEASFDRAIDLDPDCAEAFNNRALSLSKRGQITASERDLREALRLRPELVEIGFNLAAALQDQGRLAEALAVYRQTIAACPDHATGHGTTLFCLSYQPDMGAQEIYAEFRAWEARHARRFLPASPPRPTDDGSGRRLRVGYVSPDFCAKSAAYFIEPLLAGHDRGSVEVFCYAEVARPDALTARFQGMAEHWRSTVGLSDEAMAELIRADRIDVLVDLAGHTANNRLLALARKPAPVQIAHFLGHGYTSGLEAMDVFLADAALAPEGAEPLFAERIERLARIPIAYAPPAGLPEPSPSPALARGYVTFGHFGRTVRLNDEVVAVWARILIRIPGARLMLNAAPFSDPGVQARYAALFAAHGVTRDRLDLVFTTPQTRTWASYGEIDIALDPFPHNAGTTTIEALWLGAPVLTLADRPSVGRFGASILGAVGLQDWVATSVEAYVEKAVAAASDLPALASLREGMRARLRASPLMDGPGLARLMEATYRRLYEERFEPAAPAPQPADAASDAELAQLKARFLADDVAGAEALARARLARRAGDPDALHLLGLIGYRRGDFPGGAALIRQSLAIRPDASAFTNLGSCLRAVGDLSGAETALAAALALEPGLNDARANYANVLLDQRRAGEAEAALAPVIASGSASANAYMSLGNALYMQGRLVQALEAFRQSLARAPADQDATRNMGSTLAALGRFEEAEVYHRRALEHRPDYAAGHSSLLFNLNYRADLTAEAIYAEYQAWDARHVRPLADKRRPHANDRDPERRLRVGYVSPDFRQHAVSLFVEELLAAHDRTQIEIVCYAEVAAQDAVSDRIKASVDGWVVTVGMSEDALAERIRADRIDVLVDFAGHSTGNRLLTFARKPAPVQVSYLVGHGYTTGLSTVDAFLADAAMVPEGSEHLFSERIVRLPRAPLAYAPPAGMPEPTPLPARAKGHVTFGHFGRSVRINDGVIAAWAEILKQVPGSRLVLNNAPFSDPDVAGLIAARFAAQGIGRERLDLIFTSPQPRTWAAYGEIDIALDPFPHNAGTTTIEALWMGVPVVSLADRPSVGRFGAMILGAVGLSDWVAPDVDTYVARAVAAAADLDGLEVLRRTLRPRFAASPLRDPKGLARAIEGAYRDLWRAWCAAPPGEPAPAESRLVGEMASVPARPAPAALDPAIAAYLRGDLVRAQRGAQAALAAAPDQADALHLRGLIAYRQGRLEAAAADVGRAVALVPARGEMRWNLTAILRSLGRLDAAVAHGREAVRLAPQAAPAFNNLGAALRDQGLAGEAETCFRRALELDPKAADAWANLAWLQALAGRARDGEGAARRAIALTPKDGNTWNTLGSTLLYQDRLDEAAETFRRAVELKPDLHIAHSNLLFCLNYAPDMTAETITAAYADWNARHAAPLAPKSPTPKRARGPGDRLRVGYVSPDFRHHAASFFVEPMLAAHDRGRIEIFCYAEVAHPDAVTQRFRAMSDHWRSTMGLSDAAVAELVAADGIDVLVDLAGHTGGNRLLTFARKPAPVQIAHMVGAGQTTGLTAIDAFLCDADLCPDGAEALFSETLVRLARLPLVYRPPEGMPEVSPSPAARKGHVTFGYFGRTARINDAVLDAWAAILREVPGARLILNSKPFQDAAARADFAERFARRGVAAHRLDLVFTTPQPATWAAYGEVDIALDPFPHNAGTTTIEALWMGAPVVSLTDRPPVGRFGAAILGAVGLGDWVAGDVSAYVARAVAAASDLEGLARLRAGLRDRFRSSPLGDAAGLARALEDVYERLWDGAR